MPSLNSLVSVSPSPMWLNLCIGSVPAGYPSHLAEQTKELVDINSYLIHNEIATYIFRVKGNAMTDAGIFDGDVLVVDRSIEPKHNDIVLVTLNNEFIVKRLYQRAGLIKLISENHIYPPLAINERDDFAVWGVVTNSIHKLC
jgi:DNA polymerase V